MDVAFCVDALDERLARFGRPEIFNTDRGSQFTSAVFTVRGCQGNRHAEAADRSLRRLTFSRSSEKLDHVIGQLELSLEELEEDQAASERPDEQGAAAATSEGRRQRGRRPCRSICRAPTWCTRRPASADHEPAGD
jgi:transposase IS166 family protein